MPNVDYPGLCLSCMGKDCMVIPGDYSSARELLSKMPEGYALTIVKNLQHAFPDKFSSAEEAYMVFDVIKTVIVNGLKIKDHVDLEGLGEFEAKKGDMKGVVFKPSPMLVDAIYE